MQAASLSFNNYVTVVEKIMDNVLLNVQLPRSVRDQFRIAAKLRGFSMSSLIHQFVLRTVREAKESDPDAFPGYQPSTIPFPRMNEVTEPTFEQARRYYAERFDADDLTETEWQFLETYFAGTIDAFKKGKERNRQAIMDAAAAEDRGENKIVAHIGPGPKPNRERDEMTREAIRHALKTDAEKQIDQRVKPRKRKAG